MPLGISAASPRPAPLGASLLSSTGSSLVRGTKIPRLTASSTFDRAPAGTSSLGNTLIFTASGVILPPRQVDDGDHDRDHGAPGSRRALHERIHPHGRRTAEDQRQRNHQQ